MSLPVQDGSFGARTVTTTSVTPALDLLATLRKEKENTKPHAIYVVIPCGRRDLVEVTLEQGFKPHQTTYAQGVPTTTFYFWCSSEANRVPDAPSTTSGAHLMLYRQEGDIYSFLAVKEGKAWGMAGGKSQPGETLWATACREVGEEINFSVPAKTVPEMVRFKCELVNDQFGSHQDISAIFALKVDEEVKTVCDGEEVTTACWVSGKDVLKQKGETAEELKARKERGDEFRSSFLETVERIMKGPLPSGVLKENGKLTAVL